MWTWATVKTDLDYFLGPKKDSNCWDVKLKKFKKDDKKEFHLVQNLAMGEADFNQVIWLKNQLVIAAEIFAREETLTPVLIPTMSKGMDEQLKLAHKVVDVVDRANRKICVTLLRYNVDKPESPSAQVRFFARKKGARSFKKLSTWIKNLKNLSMFLMWWILYMIKLLLINQSVMSYKK